MFLAVILALVPLTLTAGGGSPLHVHVGPGAAGAEVLETNNVSYAASRAENIAPNSAHDAAVPPSQRMAPALGSHGAVSRGASPARAGRTGLIQGSTTAEVWNVRKQLRLAWPLRGALTSGFGWRTHPIFGTREFHTGIDIAGWSGEPIVAAYWGTVRFVGWKGGYGQVVIVDHGHGVETSYAHLSSTTVKPGEFVEQGEQVGRTGSTGWSTGPHLFFEVYEDGIPRNPTSFLP